jgi:hypothetical protein
MGTGQASETSKAPEVDEENVALNPNVVDSVSSAARNRSPLC